VSRLSTLLRLVGTWLIVLADQRDAKRLDEERRRTGPHPGDYWTCNECNFRSLDLAELRDHVCPPDDMELAAAHYENEQ
jgi:hypothetical protein